PSTRLCPQCGAVNGEMTLADRVFACECGHTADRDTNAAINLARWGHAHHDSHRSPDPQAGGRATNARQRDGAHQHPVSVKPARMTREPTFTPPPRPEPMTPEKGGGQHSLEWLDTL
ncbi:MAG TPA: zinc ribbon domain-containing protein, partial [Mycobacterium sp.]